MCIVYTNTVIDVCLTSIAFGAKLDVIYKWSTINLEKKNILVSCNIPLCDAFPNKHVGTTVSHLISSAYIVLPCKQSLEQRTCCRK